jgi:tetratricopeptide (TPR) repeat protein
MQQHSFLEELPSIVEPSNESQSQQWDRFFEQVNQIEIETNRALQEPRRNELCNCGSGRKYKKCCMNKPLLPDLLSNIKIEESIISYGSLEYSNSLKALPEIERESILNLYPLVAENPEEVLQIAPTYIEKYPDIPMLYNFLYGAYRKLKRPREAMNLMKKTLQIFPDYLFGRVEYALYLLRRGEPEKAHAALGNAGTLSQLYPERKVFHATEWKAFAYAMSRCWIQKNDLNQAKIYLEIVQKISPKGHEIRDLQKKMKSKVFAQFIEKRQTALTNQMTTG